MKKFRKYWYCTIIVLFAATFSVNAQGNLPDVTVTKLGGEKTSIADFGKNGKITVLNFWATWCSPCKKELSNISEVYADWQEKYNMELLAISIDDTRNVAKVKTYVAGQDWEYIILLDTNQELKRALNFLEDDEDMEEAGVEYSELVTVEFNCLPYS